MALSITLGVFFGIIPLIGVATPAVTFLAIAFRLNLPIAIFMTYAVSPLHILLFIPFIYAGEWIVGVDHQEITFEAVKHAFQSDFFSAMADLAQQLGLGLIGWIILASASAIFLFWTLYGIFSLLQRKQPKPSI